MRPSAPRPTDDSSSGEQPPKAPRSRARPRPRRDWGSKVVEPVDEPVVAAGADGDCRLLYRSCVGLTSSRIGSYSAATTTAGGRPARS
jgi:hypothetical protein